MCAFSKRASKHNLPNPILVKSYEKNEVNGESKDTKSFVVLLCKMTLLSFRLSLKSLNVLVDYTHRIIVFNLPVVTNQFAGNYETIKENRN